MSDAIPGVNFSFSWNKTPPNAKATYQYGTGFNAFETHQIGRFASAICKTVWSPIIWNGGKRKQANFISADWLALDFDDGELTLEQAKIDFCDMIHLIGTTKSHQKPKHGITCDRFRVVLRLERPITDLKTYRYNMKIMTNVFPCDPQCKDAARYFFPCQDIVSMSPEGYCQEVNEAPLEDEFIPVQIKYKTSLENHQIPEQLVEKFNYFFKPDERNKSCFCIAKDLLNLNFNFDEIKKFITDSESFRKYSVIGDPFTDRELNNTLSSAVNNFKEGGK